MDKHKAYVHLLTSMEASSIELPRQRVYMGEMDFVSYIDELSTEEARRELDCISASKHYDFLFDQLKNELQKMAREMYVYHQLTIGGHLFIIPTSYTKAPVYSYINKDYFTRQRITPIYYTVELLRYSFD